MKKEPKVFEVGERCVCYNGGARYIGEIKKQFNQYGYIFSTEEVGFAVHEKQLRKLVKKKRRGWWMKELPLVKSYCSYDEYNAYIRTTKPDDTTGWIYVEEKRVK